MIIKELDLGMEQLVITYKHSNKMIVKVEITILCIATSNVFMYHHKEKEKFKKIVISTRVQHV
jgi:hypothetical protein